MSGISGKQAVVRVDSTVSGDAIVVATDTYSSSVATITGQQTDIRNIDQDLLTN